MNQLHSDGPDTLFGLVCRWAVLSRLPELTMSLQLCPAEIQMPLKIIASLFGLQCLCHCNLNSNVWRLFYTEPDLYNSCAELILSVINQMELDLDSLRLEVCLEETHGYNNLIHSYPWQMVQSKLSSNVFLKQHLRRQFIIYLRSL